MSEALDLVVLTLQAQAEARSRGVSAPPFDLDAVAIRAALGEIAVLRSISSDGKGATALVENLNKAEGALAVVTTELDAALARQLELGEQLAKTRAELEAAKTIPTAVVRVYPPDMSE